MLLSLALYFLRRAMRAYNHADDQHVDFVALEQAEALIAGARDWRGE